MTPVKRSLKILSVIAVGLLGSVALGVSNTISANTVVVKSSYTGNTILTLSVAPGFASLPMIEFGRIRAGRLFFIGPYTSFTDWIDAYNLNKVKHIITFLDSSNGGVSILIGYAYSSQIPLKNVSTVGLVSHGNGIFMGNVYARKICFHDGTSVVKCIDASGVTTENSNLQINWTSGKIRSKKGYEIDLDYGIARLKKVEDDSGVFYIDLSNGDASISTIYQSKIISVNMNDNKTYTVDPAGSSTMYKLEVKKFSLLSDARLKDIVGYYNNVLEYYPYLYAVKFKWKNDKDNNIYVGVIAQNIMKYFPELVKKDSNGYYTVSYEGLTAINTEAIKELYEKYQKLKEENEQLKAKIEELEKEVEELKSLVEGK